MPKILLSRFLSTSASLMALKEYLRICTILPDYVLVEDRESGTSYPTHLFHNEDLKLDAIRVTHFDLDNLGKILSLQGKRPSNPEVKKSRPSEAFKRHIKYGFWHLVDFDDAFGRHSLCEWDPEFKFHTTNVYEVQIDLFDAWTSKNLCPIAPSDGSVIDITEYVLQAEAALHAILAQTAHLLTTYFTEPTSEGNPKAEPSLRRVEDSLWVVFDAEDHPMESFSDLPSAEEFLETVQAFKNYQHQTSKD